jgi:predicted dehydrogenase
LAVFGVIGLGSIARRHLANLRHMHPNEEIYAVSASGINKDIPANINGVVSIAQLITFNPKYVIVASPAPFHVNVAQNLLAHQIPVLIEKPLAHDAVSGASLQRYCSEHKINTVAVGYCLRFMQSSLAVKEFLGTNALGKIYNVSSIVGQYLPSWRPEKDFKHSVSAQKKLGGGALLELSHELDYLQWLLGDLTLQHSSLRNSIEFDLDVEDMADLTLTTSTGILLNVHLDFVQKATQRKCQIIGKNGRVDWDLIANSVMYYSAEGQEILYADPKYDKNNMYISMLQEFERCLRKKGVNLASIDSSVKILELIDSAKRHNEWRSFN